MTGLVNDSSVIFFLLEFKVRSFIGYFVSGGRLWYATSTRQLLSLHDSGTLTQPSLPGHPDSAALPHRTPHRTQYCPHPLQIHARPLP